MLLQSPRKQPLLIAQTLGLVSGGKPNRQIVPFIQNQRSPSRSDRATSVEPAGTHRLLRLPSIDLPHAHALSVSLPGSLLGRGGGVSQVITVVAKVPAEGGRVAAQGHGHGGAGVTCEPQVGYPFPF